MDPEPLLRFREAIIWAGEPGKQPEGWGVVCAGKWSAWVKGQEGVIYGLPDYPTLVREFHPHEKPVDLMTACIRHMTGQTILDPYMGSSTTGVAAVRMGLSFIGCEVDPRYFDIACKRIAEALS